jgi:NDP-sugar pyrophosphorylase family protein
MRPLTNDVPKALLNIAGKTLLEWAVMRYNQAGIEDIVIAVGWKGSMIEDFVSSTNISARVVHVSEYEKGPLQTLLTAIETLEGDFLLSPVDAIMEPDSLTGMLVYHAEIGVPEGMILSVGSEAESGTPVECNEDNLLMGIGNIKPETKNVTRSAMLLLANTRIRDLCKSSLSDGKEKVVQLLEQFIQNGSPVHCFHVSHSWFDIDTLSDLLSANRHFLQKGGLQKAGSVFVPSGDSIEVGNSVELKSNILIGQGTTLQGPVLIHSDCKIDSECKVGPNVSISSNTTISRGCEVKDSVISGDSVLPAESRVQMSIIHNSRRYSSEMK